MTLIAILVSLFLERTAARLRAYRRYDWLDAYVARMRSWLGGSRWDGPLGVLVVAAPVVLVVALLVYWLSDLWLGVPALIFYIVALYLTLGPEDLDDQVDEFLNAWDAQDEAEARRAAAELLDTEEVPEDRARLQHALAEKILIGANERTLAVFFWFVLLAGPVGAVLYRLACRLKDVSAPEGSGFAQAAQRLHDILAYIPAHLCTLGYGMAGSFVDALHNWRAQSPTWAGDWQRAVEGTLTAGGLGALQVDIAEPEQEPEEVDHQTVYDTVKSAMGLVWRTVIIWVAVIAVLTMTGWAG